MTDPIRAAVERLKPFIPKPTTTKKFLKELEDDHRDMVLKVLDAITNGTAILTSDQEVVFECPELITNQGMFDLITNNDCEMYDLLANVLRTHGVPGVKSISCKKLPESEYAICVHY